MEMTNTGSGVATAGLTTGVIGTALGLLNGAGGLMGMGMHGSYGGYDTMTMRMIEAERRSAVLESELDAHRKMSEVYVAAANKANEVRDELSREIRELERKVDGNIAAQSVLNAKFGHETEMNKAMIHRLYSLTKLVIPNDSICPGWDETVTP